MYRYAIHPFSLPLAPQMFTMHERKSNFIQKSSLFTQEVRGLCQWGCSSWLRPSKAEDCDNRSLASLLVAEGVGPEGVKSLMKKTAHQCPRASDCPLGAEGLT